MEGRYEYFFFFQAEDGIRDWSVTGVQTCALPISGADFGLINYDERINDSARFLTGELIPSQHFYPPFFNYLIGIAFVGLAAFGLLTDMWSNAGEFRQAYFADATPFYLTARYLTACIGALAAPLAYACSRQIGLTPVSSFLVGAFSALLPDRKSTRLNSSH